MTLCYFSWVNFCGSTSCKWRPYSVVKKIHVVCHNFSVVEARWPMTNFWGYKELFDILKLSNNLWKHWIDIIGRSMVKVMYEFVIWATRLTMQKVWFILCLVMKWPPLTKNSRFLSKCTLWKGGNGSQFF